MAETDIENEESENRIRQSTQKRFNIDVDTLILNIKFSYPKRTKIRRCS